jgi:hypothetical protein
MKKVILSLVFVFATGTMMNANSSVEEITTPEIETIEIVEDFGCRGDCNSDARYWALELSEDQDDRGAGGELMTKYNEYYSSCVGARC